MPFRIGLSPNQALQGMLIVAVLVFASTSFGQEAAAPKVVHQRLENYTPLDKVPAITTRVLAPSHVPTGGANPDVTCILYDNVSVQVINNVPVEVHECDSASNGHPVPDTPGGAPAPSNTLSPGTTITPTPAGVQGDVYSCQLFATTLKNLCMDGPAETRAACNYNACVSGARCDGLSPPYTQQCGAPPKAPSGKSKAVISCTNQYAANFNACTSNSRTLSGQNSCLFAAQKATGICMQGSPVSSSPR